MAADPLPKPRVVLADDNQRMHEAVVQVLSYKSEAEVVGCALDGARAIELLATCGAEEEVRTAGAR